MKEKLKSQPPQVKKNMWSKIISVVNPSMTDHQPPEVQTKTRGRPKGKGIKQEEDAEKKVSIIIITITIINIIIINYYEFFPLQEDEPVRRRRPSDQAKDKNVICDKDFPLLVGNRYINNHAYRFQVRRYVHTP